MANMHKDTTARFNGNTRKATAVRSAIAHLAEILRFRV
jgi:hypothetical protein